ncbi:MAG: hypothetical protein ACI8PQ_002631 [Planctomycetota bacterium]|jgi:hypothetical protein
MFQSSISLAVLFALSSTAAGQIQPASDTPTAGPTAGITGEELEDHVSFLASDELNGRRTGSEEAKLAAGYIAAALKDAGVAPIGDDGTFFQRVPLVDYSFEENPTLVVEMRDGSSWTAQQGTDFRLRVNGVPDTERSLAMRSTENIPDAAERSACALFVPGLRTEAYAWLEAEGFGRGEEFGLLVLEGSKREGRARSMRGGRLSLVPSGPDPADQVIASGKLLAAFFESEVVSVKLMSNATVADRSCQNVLGILRGKGTATHPELAKETIVISAHYDHIGPRGEPTEDAPDEDRIFNGADDDASGVAAVLELAEAFAQGETPARTIIFMLATGEEVGLLGTKHYLDNPVVPLEQTYYNLNIEMIGRPDDLMPGPGDLWLTGWDETTLGPQLAGANQPVQRDPRPEQNFYQRSDNIAFVNRGIMGQTLSSYGMHDDYHHASDETETLDFAHMEIATNNILTVARALAIDGMQVDWKQAVESDK